ncbi:MAG: UPF0147 family protein [Nitrososphaerota archaeon]|nr:UPF0147 family protein [Nitrososphaerota archaeon]
MYKTPRKKDLENEEKIIRAIEMLSFVVNDVTTPRNIRNSIKEVIANLSKKNTTPGIRAAAAINVLDEISQDPNLSTISRTRIWSSLTLLEDIKD